MVFADPRLVIAQTIQVLEQLKIALDAEARVFVQRMEGRQESPTAEAGSHGSVLQPVSGRTHQRRLPSKRKISTYSQTSVTTRPKAEYHSMYFGLRCATPLAMKSKSITRLSAARPTTNRLNAIPKAPPSWMKETG